MARRRGSGEGSIYKTGDGRWRGAVTLPGGRRKYLSGRTRREVASKIAAAVRASEDGTLVLDERQTVAQFLDRWLADTVKSSTRPRTYESYESKVRLYIKPALGRVRLNRLTPQHVQRMMKSMADRELAPRTIAHARTVLRTALGQAMKWGLVSRNVASLVDPPRVEATERTILTPEQAREFLNSVEDNRLSALYHVAITLGLRQGEILGLRWADVDLDSAVLRVKHTLQRIGGEPVLAPPKTKQSVRTLPLHDGLVAVLRRHRAAQRRERLAAGERWTGWRGGELVFTSTVGTPLDSPNLNKRFQRALQDAGLPRMRFHDLRHSCASFMIAQGEHPRVVMEQLGHSQISTTMEIYAQVMPGLKREAADRMEALLSDAG